MPSLPPASVDLVLVTGALERTPWDRWTLQLAHRAMRDGARLILVAPNFLGLATPGAVGFLAARLAREGRLRRRRPRGLPPPRARSRGRRYRRADLRAMPDALGFAARACETRDPGWRAPIAALSPAATASVSRSHVVLAERVPSLFGSDPRRPFPDPGHHRRE